MTEVDHEALSEESGTWHYGLLARWWAEFKKAEAHELAYFRSAIETFGQPVIDLGCGAGRFVAPLVSEGFDVDGVDISADMIAAARASLPERAPTRLSVQALHELEVERSYGTAYMCGVFGIGGRRDRDQEALRRIYQILRPGGALLIIHHLPYNDTDESWVEWLPGHRAGYPPPWPESGKRKRTAAGDEIELLSRAEELDPLQQQVVLAMRARLWRDGQIVKEESYRLRSCLYFAQEICLMLADAGFQDVVIEGNYTGLPATGDDGNVIFVARKQPAGHSRPHIAGWS